MTDPRRQDQLGESSHHDRCTIYFVFLLITTYTVTLPPFLGMHVLMHTKQDLISLGLPGRETANTPEWILRYPKSYLQECIHFQPLDIRPI